MTTEIIVALIGGSVAIIVVVIQVRSQKGKDRATPDEAHPVHGRGGTTIIPIAELESTKHYQESITPERREAAALLVSRILSDLEAFRFPSEAVIAFENSYGELVENAFEHGCVHPTDKVTVAVEMTRAYLTLTVDNQPGHTFDLAKVLMEMQSHPDVSRPRGRGLLQVADHSDRMEATPEKTGVRIVIYRDRVRWVVHEMENIVFILIKEGVRNPSFQRRYEVLIGRYPAKDMVIDLPMPLNASVMISRALATKQAVQQKGGRVVLVGSYAGLLPADFTANSIEDALNKLGKSNLIPRLNKVLKEAARRS